MKIRIPQFGFHHPFLTLVLLTGFLGVCLPSDAGSSRDKRAVRALKKSVRKVRVDLAKVSSELQNLPTAPQYGDNPLVLAGYSISRDITNSRFGSFIQFQKDFMNPPVIVATVDETINQNGASWVRQDKIARANEVAIGADNPADRIHWFALEPGTYRVSGKTVQSGRAMTGSNPATVTFPQAFSSTPVVFLMVDASQPSGPGSGPTWIRVASVTANGFTASASTSSYKFQWIAMEAGSYQHGRFKWYAGEHANPGSGSQTTISLPAGFNATERNPGVIVTKHDTNGSGATWIRLRELAPQSVLVRLGSTGTELINYLFFFEEK